MKIILLRKSWPGWEASIKGNDRYAVKGVNKKEVIKFIVKSEKLQKGNYSIELRLWKRKDLIPVKDNGRWSLRTYNGDYGYFSTKKEALESIKDIIDAKMGHDIGMPPTNNGRPIKNIKL